MEILGTRKMTGERWVNLYVRDFRHNGAEGRWCFASRGDGSPPPPERFDAVVIVPVVVGDGPPRLVLVREFRVPVGDWVYALPAGLAEGDESPEDVARRELREETGLEVVEVRQVSPPVYSSAGLTDESAVMVFVTAKAVEGGVPAHDAHEEIEILQLDYDALVALCDSGARFDAKAWLVLHMIRTVGRLA